jgi:hypothetical protein
MPPPSGQESPAESPRQPSGNTEDQFWETCDAAEFTRLITIYQEEIESVYPCLNTGSLIKYAPAIPELGRMPEDEIRKTIETRRLSLTVKDVHLAKLAMATTIVIEGHGKSEKSSKLVEPVERSLLSILEPSRELKDLQLFIALVSCCYAVIDVEVYQASLTHVQSHEIERILLPF